MLILLIATLLLSSAGVILARRLGPPLGPPAKLPQVSVTVIIPARNEAHNLPTLLRSLALQTVGPREIIVVDDASSDATTEVAHKLGATVLTGQPLPDGWRGKPWACEQGARAATGELLLFLDADTWLEPGGLARILSASRGGAFSIGPYHAVRDAYEHLSLFFNINMNVGTVPAGLFGQMLLVDRKSYWAVGGHSRVSGRVLENFHLAREFRTSGIPARSAIGKGALSFRMYPNGVRELIAGWAKGFVSGAGQTSKGLLLLIIAWMTGLMLAPVAGCMTGDWLTWGGAYLYGAAQVWAVSRKIGAFGWRSPLLYPVPLVFFFLVFGWSAARSGKPVVWKGREIRAD